MKKIFLLLAVLFSVTAFAQPSPGSEARTFKRYDTVRSKVLSTPSKKVVPTKEVYEVTEVMYWTKPTKLKKPKSKKDVVPYTSAISTQPQLNIKMERKLIKRVRE